MVAHTQTYSVSSLEDTPYSENSSGISSYLQNCISGTRSSDVSSEFSYSDSDRSSSDEDDIDTFSSMRPAPLSICRSSFEPTDGLSHRDIRAILSYAETSVSESSESGDMATSEYTTHASQVAESLPPFSTTNGTYSSLSTGHDESPSPDFSTSTPSTTITTPSGWQSNSKSIMNRSPPIPRFVLPTSSSPDSENQDWTSFIKFGSIINDNDNSLTLNTLPEPTATVADDSSSSEPPTTTSHWYSRPTGNRSDLRRRMTGTISKMMGKTSTATSSATSLSISLPSIATSEARDGFNSTLYTKSTSPSTGSRSGFSFSRSGIRSKARKAISRMVYSTASTATGRLPSISEERPASFFSDDSVQKSSRSLSSYIESMRSSARHYNTPRNSYRASSPSGSDIPLRSGYYSAPIGTVTSRLPSVFEREEEACYLRSMAYKSNYARSLSCPADSANHWI